MRTDTSVARRTFRYSEQWRRDAFDNVSAPEIDRRLKGGEVINGRMVVHSLSGHERNHLFSNGQGQNFDDISLISGLDTPADSRSFGLLDYDHDGRQDIALVNANTPLFNLYRNTMSGRHPAENSQKRFIAVRFRGGNTATTPSKLACRDGFGAMVTVVAGGKTIKREQRCGEGYGAQNSSTMIVGIGEAETIDSISVRWPNGTETTDVGVLVKPGSLVTVSELPAGEPIVVGTYSATQVPPPAFADTAESLPLLLDDAPSLPTAPATPPKLRLYMTMATWCVACKEQTPHLTRLASLFTPEELEIIGLPIDPKEDAELVRQYAETIHPPYRQVLELTATQRRAVQTPLGQVAPPDAIPGSLVTDEKGNVLAAYPGVPTVSELRKHLETVERLAR